MVQPRLIDGCAGQDKRQDAGPGNAKGVVLYSHARKPLNVLFVEVIVLVCHVVLGSVILDENLPKRGRPSLLRNRTFDLTCGSGDSENEALGGNCNNP